MAVLEVEFVFSCPCFVSDVLSAMQKSRMNYEIGGYVSGNNVAKHFEVVYFKNESSVFICCHGHPLDSMHFDTKNCLHYDRRVHFRMHHDFNYYWAKKVLSVLYDKHKEALEILPKVHLLRKYEDSAGFDLDSVENVTISSNSIKVITTDIGLKIPKGYFGKIYARSSLVVRCTEIGGVS